MHRCTLAVWVSLLLLGGCSRSKAPAEDVDEARVRDPLAAAPTTPEDFLAWADGKLRETPKPQPFPASVRIPDRRWPVTRLAKLVHGVDAEVRWTPPQEVRRSIVEVGPFRSDQPSAVFAVERESAPSGRTSLRMTIRGFSVERARVGGVSLEVRVPYGEHIDLIWSTAGRVRIPVPGHDKFWTLNLTTDGLADWLGRLDRLILKTDGLGPGRVSIRKIRFLAHADAFPDAYGARRVRLADEIRDAVYIHAPGRLTFPDVLIPDSARLHVGLGVVEANPSDGARSTPVKFTVTIDAGEAPRSVLSQEVAEPGSWHDMSLSLDDFGGQRVALTLSVEGPADAVGVWGSPTIYEPVADAPLVIIYLIDALGAKHIDLYGYGRPTMPRLAKLADRGVWFSNAFCNAPQTVSSVPSLLLGLPPEQHGVNHPSVRAPDALVSLAEALGAAGFASASFCTNVNAGPRQAMDQGFESFFDRIAYWWTPDADRTVPIEDVMRWLEQRADRPCFLYIHTAEPHTPYLPPPGFAGRFSTSETAGRELAEARYDEECLYADARLGQFLDALDGADLLERTSLFVTSDHGEEFYEHGFDKHGNNLYSEVHRIPLVVAGPWVTARGRSDVPVQLLDVMPTVLGALSLPTPYSLPGDNLLPLMRRGGASPAGGPLAKRSLFAANYRYSRFGVTEAAVIEHGAWKLMYRFAGGADGIGKVPARFELYDIRADAAERDDVLDQHPDVARRLVGRLLRFRDRWRPFSGQAQRDEISVDPAQLKTLQSLGYIGEFEEDGDGGGE